MSLTSKLTAPPAPRSVKTRIDLWMETLNETDRKAVLAAAVDPAWGHMQLRDVLIAEGMPELSDNALRGWRVKQGWEK